MVARNVLRVVNAAPPVAQIITPEGKWNSPGSFANIRLGPTAYLEGARRPLPVGTQLALRDCGIRGRGQREPGSLSPQGSYGSFSPGSALQHLPYAPAFAVAAVVGKPVRALSPRSEALVGRERLRLPEAALLPATPVGRILAANLRPSGGSFTDHRSPPTRVAPTSIM